MLIVKLLAYGLFYIMLVAVMLPFLLIGLVGQFVFACVRAGTQLCDPLLELADEHSDELLKQLREKEK